MKNLQRSFEKFDYLLRPSKQVERKLIIETLLRLRAADYNISDYTYLGFGSVYYVDFILFHKYLYIDKMICVEHEPIEKRMKFNRPYRFIRLRMSPVDDVVLTLSRNKRHFVWLDYDSTLQTSILDNIDSFLQQLAPKSILLITIDARARVPREEEDPNWSDSDRDCHALDYFKTNFERIVGRPICADELQGKRTLRGLLARIIRGKIEEAMLGRSGYEFIPLFNFYYSDNAPMLTIGGIIEKEGEGRLLWADHLRSLKFLTRRLDPVQISVPALTLRERHWLDQNIANQELVRRPPFELRKTMLNAYSKYNRHYPDYHEVVI